MQPGTAEGRQHVEPVIWNRHTGSGAARARVPAPRVRGTPTTASDPHGPARRRNLADCPRILDDAAGRHSGKRPRPESWLPDAARSRARSGLAPNRDAGGRAVQIRRFGFRGGCMPDWRAAPRASRTARPNPPSFRTSRECHGLRGGPGMPSQDFPGDRSGHNLETDQGPFEGRTRWPE